MMKWLLAGTAAISMTAAAAEPENRTFRSGAFEVTAIQDAPSTMRAGLFPAIPETAVSRFHVIITYHNVGRSAAGLLSSSVMPSLVSISHWGMR